MHTSREAETTNYAADFRNQNVPRPKPCQGNSTCKKKQRLTPSITIENILWKDLLIKQLRELISSSLTVKVRGSDIKIFP
ncbi:hypothetical protein NPIL_394511 [Nephila pilipes]|uniref:Uncharacterized protein n=1 Tax=Nephila pilipes TaxID=299642 RepID=A0A8X6TLD5_NEPPI|nr:hypothetical protein NPIL_394511 [Nephila pilipes]